MHPATPKMSDCHSRPAKDLNWSPHTARRAAWAAVRACGLDDVDIEPVRFGKNAVYRIGQPDLTLRIAPPGAIVKSCG